MTYLVSIQRLLPAGYLFDCSTVSVHFLHVGQVLALEGVQFQGRRSSSLVIGWPLDMRSSTSLR